MATHPQLILHLLPLLAVLHYCQVIKCPTWLPYIQDIPSNNSCDILVLDPLKTGILYTMYVNRIFLLLNLLNLLLNLVLWQI